MAKITTLKPQIQLLDTRTLQAAPTIGATPRTRGDKWMRIRARWLREFPLCRHCEAEGIVMLATEVDHVIPLWEGGTDAPENFQSLCSEHHARKTAEEAKRRAARYL